IRGLAAAGRTEETAVRVWLAYFLGAFTISAIIGCGRRTAGPTAADGPAVPVRRDAGVGRAAAPDPLGDDRSLSSAAIRKLVADLARVDRPDLGLSANATGRAFAPLAGR